MSAGWNRRRPTRATISARQQECRLLDAAADHYWNAVRLPRQRSWHCGMVMKYVAMAREARSQVGPVLP